MIKQKKILVFLKGIKFIKKYFVLNIKIKCLFNFMNIYIYIYIHVIFQKKVSEDELIKSINETKHQALVDKNFIKISISQI